MINTIDAACLILICSIVIGLIIFITLNNKYNKDLSQEKAKANVYTNWYKAALTRLANPQQMHTMEYSPYGPIDRNQLKIELAVRCEYAQNVLKQVPPELL